MDGWKVHIMNCFTFVFVQLLSVCHSKLVVSEAEWKEMNQSRTVDKILEQADLIESVTEVADWCPWVKVCTYKICMKQRLIHIFYDFSIQ